jgi:hypothetical protein
MSLDLIQAQRERIDVLVQGMDVYDKSLSDLEDALREKDRMITGMREALRRAANYRHDDLRTQVEGIQILLGKAAEYEPRRPQKRGRR